MTRGQLGRRLRCSTLPDQPGVCADGASHSARPQGELVIDGGTLDHVLGPKGDGLEKVLADVCARCGAVVICRSSPSQKAAVVRMMSEYEMSQARRTPSKVLGLGSLAGFVGCSARGWAKRCAHEQVHGCGLFVWHVGCDMQASELRLNAGSPGQAQAAESLLGCAGVSCA